MAYRGSALAPFFTTGFTPLLSLRREIDRLFEDVAGGTKGAWLPAVDVREEEKSLAIDVELPGIKPEEVTIDVENGVLTLSGEKRAEREEKEKGRYHMVERTYGSFLRSFQLPPGVDESQIKAEFADGLLTIRIPKTALPQPRRIEIATKEEKEVRAAPAREPVSGRTAGAKETAESGKMAASGASK